VCRHALLPDVGEHYLRTNLIMRKVIILTFLGLSCCTSDKKESDTTETQETSNVDNEFAQYLDLLPTLSLPFETNCEKCCDHLKIDDDNKLIEKFKPEGAAIVGLVSRTEDRAIILVTYPADLIIPSIKVYDLKGNLTGDMTFMTSYCGGEPGFYSRQFFRINSDILLTQIDTLYETTFDSVTYHTLDTTDIKITTKNFRVNEKGEVAEDNAR
jgi:hypothetical protein